jgi:hypothetical protein
VTIVDGQLFTKPRQRVIRLWAAFAILTLGIGLLIALQPERASDLAHVAGWTGDWLLRGQDVYNKPGLMVVYPPHAIVLLSPLVACWSLLTFYHLSYGYVVLLPVLMLLVFNDTPQTSLRRWLLWTLQIGMMLNVPGGLRHAGLEGDVVAGALIHHFDRIFMLALFAGLAGLAWRE